jgi:hypothetical protein
VRLTPWLNTLDVDGIARLLTLRADVGRARPGSVTELARRLSAPASVAAAVSRLDRDCLLVAQSVVILGDGTDVDRVRGFVRGADHLLDAALERLRDRGLAWPGSRPGSLRITVALDHHWQHPLGLGPTAATVLDPMTKDPIREIAQRLGAPKGNTRDDAVRSVCRAVSDAPAVRERAASASPAARTLLQDLVWNPASVPPPRHAWQDRYQRQREQSRLPAEELYDLGLLLVGSDWGHGVVPRETALAVRGPQWGPELCGAPAGPAIPVPVEVCGAGPVALESLESIRRVVEAVAARPLAPVKAGGLGQREVQRVARDCGFGTDPTRLWLELAVRIGLLGPGADGQYRPTTWVKAWHALEAADQWAHLVTAWWRSTDPSAGTSPGLQRLAAPVLQSLVAADTLDVRRAVVDVLAGLPPGHTTHHLAAAVSWLVPAWPEAGGRTEAVLAQAEALGVAETGVITPVGRAVASVSGDVKTAAAALLPPGTSTVALQSDLTAVAVGAVPAATAGVLDAAADREGVGVWRFSRASLRRALDGGQTGAELTAALAGVASAGLPQVLAQLIQDVTRVHGNLRVVECGCCLVAAEESLLKEVLGARAGLHQVAPKVAVGPGSAAELVSALRDLGYAPVIDPASGAAHLTSRQAPRPARGRASTSATDEEGSASKGRGPSRRTSAPQQPSDKRSGKEGDPVGLAVFDPPGLSREQPDPLAVAAQVDRADLEARIEQAVDRLTTLDDGERFRSRLAAEHLRLLARAQEEGLTVLVEYSRSFTSRASSLYLLDEVSLGQAKVRAWNPRWESDAVFHLHELVNVELVR